MAKTPRAPSLTGQVLTCVLFAALAVILIAVFHPEPKLSAVRVGMAAGVQLAIAGVFAAACLAVT